MPREYVDFGVADANRRPSPIIWGPCPWSEASSGQRAGPIWFDDFVSFRPDGTVYDYVAGDAGSSIAGLGTTTGGVLRLATGATDNNEVYVSGATSATTGPAFCAVDGGAGDVFFEIRFAVNSVTDGAIAFGLGEIGIVAADMLANNTGALVDKDYIGFRILTADSDGLDAVYNTSGGGGESVHKEEALVVVPGTFYKAGFRYNDVTRRCYWYVNGVAVDVSGVSEAASNFPDGEVLHWFAGAKTGQAASLTLDIDWIKIAAVID